MTVSWREVVDKACIEKHAQHTSNEVVCVSRRMGSETYVKIEDCICKGLRKRNGRWILG